VLFGVASVVIQQRPEAESHQVLPQPSVASQLPFEALHVWLLSQALLTAQAPGVEVPLQLEALPLQY
jgi:hypothetical protein